MESAAHLLINLAGQAIESFEISLITNVQIRNGGHFHRNSGDTWPTGNVIGMGWRRIRDQADSLVALKRLTAYPTHAE